MKIDRTLTLTFKELYDLYPKIYLDVAFQRKGGWDRGSGWTKENFPAYINSIMSDSYGNSITMVKILDCHDSILNSDKSLEMVDDIEYYNKLLESKQDFLSVDGWNTTSCIYSFIENMFTIPVNGKELYYKDLHPSIQKKFLSKKISYQLITEASLLEVTTLFRLMNSSTALRAQERRQARFTDFANTIRMFGEDYSKLFHNWVYCNKDDLDRRMHEESLALLVQARNKQHSKMRPKELDTLYEEKESMTEEEKKQIKKILNIMNEISEKTGPLSSDYRFTRGDFIVLFCIIEHLLEQRYTIVDHLEFYEFYCRSISFFKVWTKDEPDETRYKRWSTAFHSGLSEKIIKLNISHLENNIDILVNNSILNKERKRKFTPQEKTEAFHSQNAKDAKGKQLTFHDLQTGKLHGDHRIPYSKGGTTSPDNLDLIKKEDNLKKGNKYPKEYYLNS